MESFAKNLAARERAPTDAAGFGIRKSQETRDTAAFPNPVIPYPQSRLHEIAAMEQLFDLAAQELLDLLALLE